MALSLTSPCTESSPRPHRPSPAPPRTRQPSAAWPPPPVGSEKTGGWQGKMLGRRGGTPMSPSPPLAEPVDPTRVRTLPRHFAWIDHRLRDRLRELSLEEIALLVFLHLAADKHGLSFWSD